MIVSSVSILCLLSILGLGLDKREWAPCAPSAQRVQTLGELVCMCHIDPEDNDLMMQKCTGLKRASKHCKVIIHLPGSVYTFLLVKIRYLNLHLLNSLPPRRWTTLFKSSRPSSPLSRQQPPQPQLQRQRRKL